MTPQLNVVRWIGMLSCLLWCGCATIRPAANKLTSSRADYQQLDLHYRTDSDRLNVGQPTHSVSQASYQPTLPLPACSIGTVRIRYPHPSGAADVGQVTVDFRAAGTETAVLPRSVWSKVHSFWSDENKPQAADGTREIWSLEIPKSQLDTIVARLENSNFFRKKVRIHQPEVFLAAQLDGRPKIGKNYKPVAELDALVLRARQQGRLVSAPHSGPAAAGWANRQSRVVSGGLIARLPAVGTSVTLPK